MYTKTILENHSGKPFWKTILEKNKTAQIVRKQFPFRLAAAKTIYRSQDNTYTKIVVIFNTKRTIPHIHYSGSKVSSIVL